MAKSIPHIAANGLVIAAKLIPPMDWRDDFYRVRLYEAPDYDVRAVTVVRPTGEGYDDLEATDILEFAGTSDEIGVLMSVLGSTLDSLDELETFRRELVEADRVVGEMLAHDDIDGLVDILFPKEEDIDYSGDDIVGPGVPSGVALLS